MNKKLVTVIIPSREENWIAGEQEALQRLKSFKPCAMSKYFSQKSKINEIVLTFLGSTCPSKEFSLQKNGGEWEMMALMSSPN